MDEDELYALPLDRFVAARDALAKELRAAGEKERAKEVKALPKPSRAAGAVNRLVREHPGEAAALREAAEALAGAQQEALAGGDASALRETTVAARAAVDALVARVEGESAATVEAVRSTLHAAMVDEEARDEVLAGRLVKERAAAGFGGFALAASVPAPSVRREPAKTKAKAPAKATTTRAQQAADADAAAEARAREAAERREREAAERAERKRRDALRRAKEAEAEAEAAVDAAQRGVEQVEATLAARKADLREAKKRLAEARRRRERAER